MTDEDRDGENTSLEELRSLVVFKFLGGGYVLGAIVLYVYQLYKMTNLFFRYLDRFPAISDEVSIFIISLAYLGIIVAPATALFIGLGMINMKKWLPGVLAIGLTIGSVFLFNNYTISQRFSVPLSNNSELLIFGVMLVSLLYVMRFRRFFSK